MELDLDIQNIEEEICSDLDCIDNEMFDEEQESSDSDEEN